MNAKSLLLLLALGVVLYFVFLSNHTPVNPKAPSFPNSNPSKPAPSPSPKCPPNRPCPIPKDNSSTDITGAFIGGNVHSDGTEIACDIPEELHRKNIASRGLGCCVFRSIDHAANWQNVPCLDRFPEWMVKKGIEGGGYPSKVDNLIPKIAADRGMPIPEYIQVQGLDLQVLKKACETGRMPCVTYSISPTGRYGGQRIAHMVNLVHADDKHFVVLDNNYIGSNAYEWMSPQEFERTYAPGWAVILLSHSPPPAPKNKMR